MMRLMLDQQQNANAKLAEELKNIKTEFQIIWLLHQDNVPTHRIALTQDYVHNINL